MNDPYQTSSMPKSRVGTVSAPRRSKISSVELSGQSVMHYSIPNVQAYGTGLLEAGDGIDSDKWLVLQPSVLLSKLNPRKGTVTTAMPSDHPVVASTEFVVLEIQDRPSRQFLHYSLGTPTIAAFLSARAESATRSHQRVQPADIEHLLIPWPQPDQRRQIADYLDHETAEIDAFIADLECAQTLVAERWQAEVNGLVWNGAPAVPLRRFVARVSQGSSPNAENQPAGPGESGVLKAGCTNEGFFSVNANKRLIAASDVPQDAFVSEGDLLVTRASGSTRHVGSAALVPNLDRSLAMSDKHYRLHPNAGVDPRYIQVAMQTAAYRSGLEPHISGAAGLAKNISISSLLSTGIPWVPIYRQQQVSSTVDASRRRLDALLSDLDAGVVLAKERRAALITAAVTGQIDVTGKQLSAAEAIQREIEGRV